MVTNPNADACEDVKVTVPTTTPVDTLVTKAVANLLGSAFMAVTPFCRAAKISVREAIIAFQWEQIGNEVVQFSRSFAIAIAPIQTAAALEYAV